jgi:hypothetical protein
LGSGASVSITIKNNGTTAINGWTLAWNFAGNQTITNMWNEPTLKAAQR